MHVAVSFGDDDEEVEELQTSSVVEILRHLACCAIYDATILQRAHLLLFFEELEQYLFAIVDGSFAEVGAQELANKLHLGVHHLAVGLDDARCQHQEREAERIALTLVDLLLMCTILLLLRGVVVIAAIAIEGVVGVGLVYGVYTLIK